MKYSHLFILSVIFIVFDYLCFQISERWIITDVFARLILWVIIVLLFLIALIKFIKKEKITIKNLMMPISVILLVYLLYFKNDLFTEKPILTAHYNGDINGLTLMLFKDKTYKIFDNSAFGGDVFTGKYVTKSDSLILSNEFPLGKERHFSNILLKSKDTIKWKNYDNNFEFKIVIIK